MKVVLLENELVEVSVAAKVEMTVVLSAVLWGRRMAELMAAMMADWKVVEMAAEAAVMKALVRAAHLAE